MHFIRSQYDSVIVQAMMEFFVSHKNTNKGGEVMDSGASSYHICGSIDKNKIIEHESYLNALLDYIIDAIYQLVVSIHFISIKLAS